MVSTRNEPSSVGIHLNQVLPCGPKHPWFGSFGSTVVAPVFAVVVPFWPDNSRAAEKASFTGAAPPMTLSETVATIGCFVVLQ